MTTAMLSNKVEAVFNGRNFGAPIMSDEIFNQNVPEGFRTLSIDLRELSALMKLEPKADLSRDEVIDAYRDDITLLSNRVHALEMCVTLAIRCSIKARKKKLNQWEDDQSDKEAQALWQVIQREIPPIGQQSLLRLDSDLAAKPPLEILSTLKQQLDTSIARIPYLFTCWLQLLVEKELIGLVEWMDIDVGRYHYFKRASEANELDRKTISTKTEDPTQPFGSRITYRDAHDITVHVRQFTERHVHHIVRGRIQNLEDYQEKVPLSVAELIDGIPKVIRPLIQIVSGEITHEQVIRRVEKDAVTVIHEEAVWKGSPAVTIGPFALAGWSSDDMYGQTRHYQGQKATSVSETEEDLGSLWKMILARFAGIAALATIMFFVVRHFDLDGHVEKQNQFEAYMASIGSTDFHEADQYDALALTGFSSDRIIFEAHHKSGGGGSNPHRIVLRREYETEGKKAPLVTEVGIYEFENPHGDIDLWPRFRIPAILHITKIDEEKWNREKDRITYAVSSRKE